MPFVEIDDVTPTEQPHDRFGVECARHLRLSLQKAHMIEANECNVTKSAPHFTKLAKEYNKEEITKVLESYCSRLTSTKIEVSSGRTFCAKYGRIKREMLRLPPPPPVISDDTREIVGYLMDKHTWRCTKQELWEAFQKSADNYGDFHHRCYEHREDSIFATLVWEHFSEIPMLAYVEEWFNYIHQKSHGWPEWNGDLTMFVWSLKSFRRLGIQMAVELSGRGDDWIDYIQQLYPDMKESVA